MTITARILDFQNIGTAWRFVLDCEDNEPRGYGVDHLPAYPTRRDGVFRQRSHADACEPWFDERARAFEDALIERLDGAGDEALDEEAVALAVVVGTRRRTTRMTPRCGPARSRRAHREVPVLLRFAAGVCVVRGARSEARARSAQQPLRLRAPRKLERAARTRPQGAHIASLRAH